MKFTPEKFRLLRENLCLSQSEMARLFDKTQGWVSHVESGRTGLMPNARKRFFSLSMEYKDDPEGTTKKYIDFFHTETV